MTGRQTSSEKRDRPEPDRQDAQWSGWMAQAQDGDALAYRQLLGAVVPLVRAIIGKRINDPDRLEDVVQDVLMSVHKNRHTYDPKMAFRPWISTITQRRTVDVLRKMYRQGGREVLVDEYPETFLSDETNTVPEDDLVFALGDQLNSALETLPAGQRTAVDLLRLREMSLKEASDASGMSVAALKVAMHRALKNLRAKMAPEATQEATQKTAQERSSKR